jgi:hypothetical protein
MFVQFISARDIAGEATKETGGTTELTTRAVLQQFPLYRKAGGLLQLNNPPGGCAAAMGGSKNPVIDPGLEECTTV